jgi:hypothetical protein
MAPLKLDVLDFLALHPRTYFKGYAAAVQDVDLEGNLESEVWLAVAEDNLDWSSDSPDNCYSIATGRRSLPVAIPEARVEAWLRKLDEAYKAEAARRAQEGCAA